MCYWPYYARQKVYEQLLDQCITEEEIIYNELRFSLWCDENPDLDTYYYWSKRIFEKIELGIGRCVELFVMNNCFRFNDRDDVAVLKCRNYRNFYKHYKGVFVCYYCCV